MSAVRMLVTCALLCACDKSSKPAPQPGSASGTTIAPIDAQRAPAPVTGDAATATLADAGVDAAPVPCTAAAIGKLRKEAEAHVKAGTYDAAIALLENDRCFLDEDQPDALKAQIAWRISDLSFAYYKAGKYGRCYSLASGQVPPHTGNVGAFFDSDHAVVSALEHNATLCQEAAAKQRGKFDFAECTLVENAFGVPASALDRTDKAACLVIEEGKEDDEGMHECGAVVLVRQAKNGKRSKTKLAIDDGNLADGGVCCNIGGVSFGRRNGNLAILVATQGRNCHGGTRASEEQHAYELKGSSLELYHQLDAIAH